MVLNNFDEVKLSKEILKYEEKSKKIFTQTKDTNICWRVWGQGKPIIFLALAAPASRQCAGGVNRYFPLGCR